MGNKNAAYLYKKMQVRNNITNKSLVIQPVIAELNCFNFNIRTGCILMSEKLKINDLSNEFLC